MQYRNIDKQALKENGYTVLAKISIVGTATVFTEDDYIVDWTYEDYRYVPNNGFVGQFVERILDGNLQNISEGTILEDTEINLQLGIVNNLDGGTTIWYDYGNFLITKVEKTDTTGNYKFESADYTKKFNNKFVDDLSYPCIALELCLSSCIQAGVELDTDKYCYSYIVPKEGLSSGNYMFNIEGKIFNFTVNDDLNFLDTIMYIEKTNKIILKKINNNFIITRSELNFTTGSDPQYSRIVGRKIPYYDFTNNDFVIENNQYEETDSLRKVMQDIGKLAYSWVRIGEDNKCHIDFTQKSKSSVDTYDILTTDEYYVSKKSDLEYGPVNKILIGIENVEGENVYKTSESYTEETECSINIYDNNLTYTDELRAIALNGCENLFGLTYTPIQIDTVGHPWLDGDELIKLINVDNVTLYTYPFNRQITYAGYITGTIGADGLTNTEVEYQYKSDVISELKKTQFIVDKNNQRITLLVSDVDELSKEYNEVSETEKTLSGYPLHIENAGAYNVQHFIIKGTTTGLTGDLEININYPIPSNIITESGLELISESGNNLVTQTSSTTEDTYTYTLTETLRKVGDIYDELDISTGKLIKRIDDEGNVLQTEEIIYLDAFEILLKEGTNDIYTDPALSEVTINYLTDNKINKTFSTKAELQITSNEINATVSEVRTETKAYTDEEITSTKSYADGKASTAESNAKSYADTVSSTAQSNAETYADGKASTAESNAKSYADTEIEQASDDLNERITGVEDTLDQNVSDLSDSIDGIAASLDDYATVQSVTTVTNTVQNIQTSLNQQINVITDIQENGVSKVSTTTGFTFDENGLTINKTNADTKTLIDEDGITVYSTVSSTDSIMLNADSTGVETENLYVRTYTQIGQHSRLRDYEDGTGIFYIS